MFSHSNFHILFKYKYSFEQTKTEPFNCCCFKLTPNLSEMYTLGRWYGLLVNCLISIVYKICIAAYWILYSEFGTTFFSDVSDGKFRCITSISFFKKLAGV